MWAEGVVGSFCHLYKGAGFAYHQFKNLHYTHTHAPPTTTRKHSRKTAHVRGITKSNLVLHLNTNSLTSLSNTSKPECCLCLTHRLRGRTSLLASSFIGLGKPGKPRPQLRPAQAGGMSATSDVLGLGLEKQRPRGSTPHEIHLPGLPPRPQGRGLPPGCGRRTPGVGMCSPEVEHPARWAHSRTSGAPGLFLARPRLPGTSRRVSHLSTQGMGLKARTHFMEISTGGAHFT